MPATQKLRRVPLMAENPLKISQRTVSELGSPPSQNPPSPASKYSQFLLKGSIFAIAIAVLPFLPSQAPDFINRTLATRTWELLHLVVVGIAVCYGLFSRRYTETEKDKQVSSQIDTTQNYVSKILHVSSVFDEEFETLTTSNENSKAQTWNSQYFPGESVVTKVNGVLSNSNRPLFLPVRSLKSSLSDPPLVSEIEDSNSNSNSPVRVLAEKSKEGTVVLPSPIPWRSRSGRMEAKEEQVGGLGFHPQYSPPPAVNEADIHRGVEGLPFRSPIPWSSRPASSSSPSPKLSPSSSLSPELREKKVEDFVKKKCLSRSSDEFPSEESGKIFRSESFPEKSERKISREEEELGKSFRSESFPEKRERKLSREEEEFVRSFRSESVSEKKERGASREEEEFGRGFRSDSFSEKKERGTSREEEEFGRGFRSDSFSEKKEKRTSREEELGKNFRSESFSEKKERNISTNGGRRIPPNPEDQSSSSSIGKSVRTIRSSESREMREIGGSLMEERKKLPENGERKKTREPESVMVEKPGKRTPMNSTETDTSSQEILRPPPLPNFSEKIAVRVEEPEEEESQSQGVAESSDMIGDTSENNGDNEVDKKADEFIAKFREQIRLQRIESIKRLSGQRAKNHR